jgi:hypothetical protein
MRQAIIQKIIEETQRKLDPTEIEEAIKLMDQVRHPHSNFNGTEEIRKWRDQKK